MMWADVVAGLCLIAGSFLAFAAGVGLVRFPDLLARLHVAAKPQVLGLVLLVTGLTLRVRTAWAAGAALLIVIFQFLTAPVAAHMIGRVGYGRRPTRPPEPTPSPSAATSSTRPTASTPDGEVCDVQTLKPASNATHPTESHTLHASEEPPMTP